MNTILIGIAAAAALSFVAVWASLSVASDADDRHDDLRAQAVHRRQLDALARVHDGIDVGKQRPIQPEQSFTLAGRDRSCVMDDCVLGADPGSDFCTPCRTDLTGDAA